MSTIAAGTTSTTALVNTGDTTGNLVFQTNGTTTAMTIDTSQNVGVGTASPAARLSVDSGSAGLMANFNSSAANGGYLRFQSSGTSIGDIGTAAQTVSGSTSDFSINARPSSALVFGTSNTERMRIDSSGNVGIGTSSPAQRLDVQSASSPTIRIRNTASATGNYSQLLLETANSFSGLGNAYLRAISMNGGNSSTSLAFGVNADGGGAPFEAMRIDSSGNLLVGTTSTSSLAASGRGLIEVNGTTDSAFAMKANNTLYGYLYNSASEFRVANITANPITFFTNNTERARISSGGGLSVYSASISVDTIDSCNNQGAGTQYSTFIGRHSSTGVGNGTVSVRIYTNGNIVNTNGSYGAISDAKMKTDIVDAGSQWNDIKAIRFRKFKMKDDLTGLVQLGVVAQELEQVSPGLIDVTPDRDDKGNDLGTITKSVKTSVLLMKAAVALQEAMARIEKLEAEVAALKGAQ